MSSWKDLARHPLSAEYKDITGSAWDRFCAAMKRTGFLADRPIVLHEGMILDGWQRFRACLETGIEPIFDTFRFQAKSPEGYVEAVNDSRRHETTAERAERIGRVVKSRSEGKSIRTIAEEEEISPKQVLRDLEKSGVAGGATPEKIKGKDGREQAATHAKPRCNRCKRLYPDKDISIDVCTACADLQASKPTKPKKVKAAKPAPETTEEALKDSAGVIVPQRLIPVFEAIRDFEAIDGLIGAAGKLCKKIEEGPAKDGKPLDPKAPFTKYHAILKAARKKWQSLRPAMVCDCGGDGCRKCNDLGWLTKEMADAAK